MALPALATLFYYLDFGGVSQYDPLVFLAFFQWPFSLFFFSQSAHNGQISNAKLGLNWRHGCARKTTHLGGPTRRSFVGKVELNRVANERN